MVAPLAAQRASRRRARCGSWRWTRAPARTPTLGRKATFPIDRLRARPTRSSCESPTRRSPTSGMAGRVRGRRRGTCAGRPRSAATSTSTRCCGGLGVAQDGARAAARRRLDRRHVTIAGRDGSSSRARRGGQAHLWGSKHAELVGVGPLQRLPDGRRRAGPGRVRRRRVGDRPAARPRGRTEHAGRGADRRQRLHSTSPLRVLANQSDVRR